MVDLDFLVRSGEAESFAAPTKPSTAKGVTIDTFAGPFDVSEQVMVHPLVDWGIDSDALDRLPAAMIGNHEVDGPTLTWLEQCLAEHRRVEDSIGAAPMIHAIRPQLRIILSLTRNSGPRHRSRVVSLAAQYAHFMAWLCNDLGDRPASLTWCDRSYSWALECTDRNMAATALILKAHVTWGSGNAPEVVRWAESALQGGHRLSYGVRGMATQMLARGHALAGEAPRTQRLLDDAELLLHQAGNCRDREPPWQYFYDDLWLTLQRGMAELNLGHRHPNALGRAEALLSRGLGRLPHSYRRDRAWYGACLARVHLSNGDLDAAAGVALEFAPDARAVNRYALTELHAVHRRLTASGSGATAAVELRDVLTDTVPSGS